MCWVVKHTLSIYEAETQTNSAGRSCRYSSAVCTPLRWCRYRLAHRAYYPRSQLFPSSKRRVCSSVEQSRRYPLHDWPPEILGGNLRPTLDVVLCCMGGWVCMLDCVCGS